MHISGFICYLPCLFLLCYSSCVLLFILFIFFFVISLPLLLNLFILFNLSFLLGCSPLWGHSFNILGCSLFCKVIIFMLIITYGTGTEVSLFKSLCNCFRQFPLAIHEKRLQVYMHREREYIKKTYLMRRIYFCLVL